MLPEPPEGDVFRPLDPAAPPEPQPEGWHPPCWEASVLSAVAALSDDLLLEQLLRALTLDLPDREPLAREAVRRGLQAQAQALAEQRTEAERRRRGERTKEV